MKITGSLFMGTARDFLERATSITYPHIHEIGEVITDYQETALKRKDSWWSHADLQGHIAISLFNELQSLRYLQDISVPEEQEKERHFSEQVTRATVNAFTQVVDGMAARFLDYSYAMCQILGLGPTSPHSIMDEGFANVSDIAFAQLEIAGPGTQLIVCDLNSIINIGDFILKRKSGEFEVIEVKRGKKRRGSRLKRQMRRLEQTSELLNTKKGDLCNRS